ncbi:BrnA antitoxin family protein [Paracraurococcus lichenis]|uniref:BrnA antitoxin family protein n=1 Tax=Paracraurococcus lichenis TaxID=3064888 RepID=A0ABT9ECK1_9PROT|nr:BrnA antitoxin family protein [Paracraurococcus sp. LOR1-02]MDO9713610.1 BrnA antitoxin family protein [Paracraurococcus sp. LOR1-02]
MRPKLQRNTPEEEADIQRGIMADPDAPEWTETAFAEARTDHEVVPAIVADHARRRGRGPQKTPIKEMVSIRLDRDVVEALRASGPGWQTRANDLLRKALGGQR